MLNNVQKAIVGTLLNNKNLFYSKEELYDLCKFFIQDKEIFYKYLLLLKKDKQIIIFYSKKNNQINICSDYRAKQELKLWKYLFFKYYPF